MIRGANVLHDSLLDVARRSAGGELLSRNDTPSAFDLPAVAPETVGAASEQFVERHPFPGPSLAIRIPGEITSAKLDILRKADAVFLEETRNAGLYGFIWQAFAVRCCQSLVWA